MAHIDVETVVLAARDLTRAGRWARASELLESAAGSDDRERAALAIERAEVEVDAAFWQRRDADASLLRTAAESAVDAPQQWTCEFMRLRAAYAHELAARLAGGVPATDRVDELRSTAAGLAERAPDTAAYLTFYRGLIEDILAGDARAARRHYDKALSDAEAEADEQTASYALRHLGGQAYEVGDKEAARVLMVRATSLRQRTGHVPGVLAQLAVAADLTREEGRADAADALSNLVRSWGAQLGAAVLGGQIPAAEVEVAGQPV